MFIYGGALQTRSQGNANPMDITAGFATDLFSICQEMNIWTGRHRTWDRMES